VQTEVVSALDVSHLTPPDAVAALRSYPRRFRSALQPLDDDEQIDEIAHRLGRDGRSAIDVVSDVTRTFVLLGEALRQIALSDQPVLHPAVADPSARRWENGTPATVEDALALLTEAADNLAQQTSELPAKAWDRTAQVAGDGTVRALDLVRDATKVGHEGLRDVERILQEVRT
jgi:hypothetical protein